MEEKTERIRVLNDRFRRSGHGGKTLVTQGILTLGNEATMQIAQKVCCFDDFHSGNDPYGEHDFGAFDHVGERIFWKIDYYGLDMQSGSQDPSDPSVTKRVLTIMLANEY